MIAKEAFVAMPEDEQVLLAKAFTLNRKFKKTVYSISVFCKEIQMKSICSPVAFYQNM